MNTARKRRAAAGLLSILTALALVLPAAAHHGGGRHGCRTATQIPACTVEGCTLTGRHVHDGETYCGAHHAGGFCTTDCYGAHTSGGHRGHC